MSKKKILIIVISALILLAAGIFVYFYIQERNSKQTKKLDSGSFSLTYAYQGNNTWTYTVTGTLPSPCYSATTDAIIAESYPEQVQIRVKASEDTTVDVCSTVVKDYSYTGTFNASSQATVALDVE
jgi:capsular polysaccharide biosynthesis protein